MPPTIYPSPLPSIHLPNESIFTHLFSSPDASIIGGHPASSPAFIDATTGTTISRLQLKTLALSFAHGILTSPRLSVRLNRGDTVLIYSPNSLTWPVVLFGSVAAGLRCTLANSSYTSHELGYQYMDSGAKVVFCTSEGVGVVRDMFKELGIVDHETRIIVLGASLTWAGGPDTPILESARDLVHFQDLLATGTLRSEAKFDGQADETVYLCYSSGTTGKPKGVETTHKNIVALVNIVQPVFPTVTAGVDVLLGILPFYHIYGIAKLVHFPFFCGIPVVIQTQFNPELFCAYIERYNVTVSLIVPPVLVIMARHPAVDRYNLTSLKWLMSGAAPLGDALVRQVTNRFTAKLSPHIRSKFAIIQGYGLTETSPTTHLLPVADALRKIGSIGILLPNLEARVVVDGDGDGHIEAKAGEPGELWIRGPTVMKGYLKNTVATQAAITHDGWFKTGDITMRDNDGFYYIVDRRKELIKYKGFQVPPAELESVLLTHPDVADAAVIGVYDDEQATELPRAYIVAAEPQHVPTEQDKAAFAKRVAVWIQNKVAKHKFLRGGVIVIDTIPKSAAGKILRRELRQRAKEELLLANAPSESLKSKL